MKSQKLFYQNFKMLSVCICVYILLFLQGKEWGYSELIMDNKWWFSFMNCHWRLQEDLKKKKSSGNKFPLYLLKSHMATFVCLPSTFFMEIKDTKNKQSPDLHLINMALIAFCTIWSLDHYFSETCDCSLAQRVCNKYNERLLALLYLCHLKQFHE